MSIRLLTVLCYYFFPQQTCQVAGRRINFLRCFSSFITPGGLALDQVGSRTIASRSNSLFFGRQVSPGSRSNFRQSKGLLFLLNGKCAWGKNRQLDLTCEHTYVYTYRLFTTKDTTLCGTGYTIL